MKSAEIREAFLRFFEEQGHTRVASSSLIPGNDPTLLFTNAGMNQFKDCFLGQEKRAYTRAVSSQKCVRAGGKHNDLENVGYTARHHTFFEMLGNFSFGDYFKRDAITFAWTFLTSDKWLNLPKEKLWVTVYASDDEAYDIWTKEVGVPAERMVRIGDNKGAPYASDNFWTMGDTGPCGPCTEIFYDHGADIWGGPPGSPEEDGDRYIEIWNNVFMQFNRTADGVLHPLPAPSVDTGMGLERISAVLQHVHSNYEIDLFQSLLSASAKAIGCTNDNQASLKVVADHIRSCGFLIADGVLPSNEGRGYVLRRIIRRACRHGNKLGAKGSFFYQIVGALVAEMGEAFPELKSQQAHIERVLKAEEEQFAKTLEQGLKILEQDLAELKGDVVPGDVVFKLYDTYGFPMDLTGDIARERNLTIDEEGFEREMEAQRVRARSASSFGMDYNSLVKVDVATEFTGYTAHSGSAKIVALYKDGQSVDVLSEGEEGVVVLDQTPFYAESGGQIGDCGYLQAGAARFDVRDTTKTGGASSAARTACRRAWQRCRSSRLLCFSGSRCRIKLFVEMHECRHPHHSVPASGMPLCAATERSGAGLGREKGPPAESGAGRQWQTATTSRRCLSQGRWSLRNDPGRRGSASGLESEVGRGRGGRRSAVRPPVRNRIQRRVGP